MDVRSFWLAIRYMAGDGALVAWLGLSLSESRQAWPEIHSSRVDSAGCGVLSVSVECDNITAVIVRSFWSSWFFTAL
jgi:hypothetical protein